MNLISKFLSISLLVIVLVSCKKDVPEITNGNLVLPTVSNNDSLPSFETSDGTLLHLKTFGDQSNPTLLLLHGGPGILDISSYTALSILQDEYFVIMFDQRGSGLSQRVSDDKISGELNLQDIQDIKSAYSPNAKINVLGHSFGGYLATYYASNFPNNVNKLILAESMPLSVAGFLSLGATPTNGKIDPNLVAVSDVDTYIQPDDYAVEDYEYAIDQNNLGIQDNMMPGEDAKKTVPLRYGYSANTQMISWLGLSDGSFSKINLLDDFNTKFSGPVLLIGASDSRVGYSFQQTYLEPFITNATLVEAENSAHFIFTFNTAPTIEIVRDFLE